MKIPRPTSPRRTRRGFTLVELLVSMTVLAGLMLLVTHLVNGTSQVIGRSGKHMDSDTEARLLFNRMAVDITRALKRPDIDYASFKQPGGSLGGSYNNTTISANLQPGNDQVAFYSETEGYFSGSKQPAGIQKSPVSIVGYRLANDPYTKLPGLLRLGKGLGWDPESGGSWGSVSYLPMTIQGQWPNLFNNDADYKTVGSQVVRFEYSYLLKASGTQPARLSITPWDSSATPAHTSIDGFRDVAAIVVALVVLDTNSRATVTDYSKLTGTAIFPDAVDAASDGKYGGDLAAAWNAVVNSEDFAARANLTPAAAAGVRVYERYFYLDTQQ